MRHGGRRTRWSRDAALGALQSLAAELGRAPYAREMGTRRCPSTQFFKKHFGSCRAAMLAAGLTPNPEGGRAIHPGKIRHPDKRHLVLVPVDPERAEELTRAKRAYWQQVAQGKHGLAGWTHPYARSA